MKPVYSLLLGLSLFSFVGTIHASFSDVEKTHEFRPAIEYLQNQEIIKGYEDGTFRPTQVVNRAEFLKILLEAKKETIADTYKNCFSDVTTEWYAKYICYAKEKQWVSGYADGSFKPWQAVNTVEAMKMLLEVNGYQDTLKTVVTTDLPKTIQQDQWYSSYLALVEKKNLLVSLPKADFVPWEPMTRGMIAEAMFRHIAVVQLQKDTYTTEMGAGLFGDLMEGKDADAIDGGGFAACASEGQTYSKTPVEGEARIYSCCAGLTERATEKEGVMMCTMEAVSSMKKTKYKGTPDVSDIALKDGVTISFAVLMNKDGVQENFAVLSTDTATPLTWDTLKLALKDLRMDFDGWLAVAKLMEFQDRVRDMGRYSSLEILGAEMDESGSYHIETLAEDPCYGALAFRYHFKDGLGFVEREPLRQEQWDHMCSM